MTTPAIGMATELAGQRALTLDYNLDRKVIPKSPPSLPLTGPKGWINSEHPIHAHWYNEWCWLERAMKGGRSMRELLRPFDWELPNGPQLIQRMRTATYINYPDMYATALLGFLVRSAPIPDYGSLGKITPSDTLLSNQTQADMFHYNVDSVGNSGSEWPSWWTERGKWAMAFGHTWIVEEAPRKGGPFVSFTDQAKGARPFLCEYKPREVWDWYFEEGVLQYAIIRFNVRRPRFDASLNGGTFNASSETLYYILIRKDYTGFDADTNSKAAGNGYYFVCDSKGTVVDGIEGNFESLQGEIPMHPLYFQRDSGSPEEPAMSRSAISELAAMAESFMNMSSAADFEVWDAAKGMEYFIGCHVDAFNLAMAKMAEGSRFIPIPAAPEAKDPRVQDSNLSVTPAQSFKERLDAKRQDAMAFSAIQTNAGPDASGAARQADFSNSKAPVLALFASELQTAQNQAIINVQLRWGQKNPGGGVIWPRKFELMKAAEAVADVFDAAVTVSAKSPTLAREGILLMTRETGMITDEDTLKTIGDEIDAGFKQDAQSAQQVLDAKTQGLNKPRKLSNAIADDVKA